MIFREGRVKAFIIALAAGFCLVNYFFAADMRSPSGLTQISEKSPFGMSGALSRPFIADDNIQHVEVLKKITELKEPYKHVQDINVKWIRPGIDIGWGSVQPTLENIIGGRFDWSVMDSVYGKVPEGINILATFSVGHANPGLGIKIGTWRFINKEAERDYIKFVREVVERYDGDGYKDMPGLKNPVKYWQTQNEPALVTERSQIAAGNINIDWRGFSNIQEITYRAIKESDPAAKIAIGGLTGGHVIGIDNHFLHKELSEFYVPILKTLRGKYIDIFDVHFYGEAMEWPDSWRKMKNSFEIIRRELDNNGFKNTEIWFTETAVPSQPFGEKEQAIGLVKRYIYPLSLGVNKIFWWNTIEGEYPLEEEKPSNHFGLVYDGLGAGDPGFGVKKLAYYTYKKMVEVLDGSDWNNIKTVQAAEGIYIFKFTKRGKGVWVLWNDNSGEKEITISGITAKKVKITEGVPKYESGQEVIDYNSAFNIETREVQDQKIAIILKDVPVLVEE